MHVSVFLRYTYYAHTNTCVRGLPGTPITMCVTDDCTSLSGRLRHFRASESLMAARSHVRTVSSTVIQWRRLLGCGWSATSIQKNIPCSSRKSTDVENARLATILLSHLSMPFCIPQTASAFVVRTPSLCGILDLGDVAPETTATESEPHRPCWESRKAREAKVRYKVVRHFLPQMTNHSKFAR